MSQRDTYHVLVREALEKDGWIITHDPYVLKFMGESNAYIDLAAEAPLGAVRDGHKIAVEVKSFLSASPMTDLERALGQYSLYGFLISRAEPDRTLFLAVPAATFYSILDEAAGRDLVASMRLRIAVFDPGTSEIVRWVNDEPIS